MKALLFIEQSEFYSERWLEWGDVATKGRKMRKLLVSTALAAGLLASPGAFAACTSGAQSGSSTNIGCLNLPNLGAGLGVTGGLGNATKGGVIAGGNVTQKHQTATVATGVTTGGVDSPSVVETTVSEH